MILRIDGYIIKRNARGINLFRDKLIEYNKSLIGG